MQKQIFEDDLKCIILRRDFIKISPQGFTINRAGEKLFHINILFSFVLRCILCVYISIRSEENCVQLLFLLIMCVCNNTQLITYTTARGLMEEKAY